MFTSVDDVIELLIIQMSTSASALSTEGQESAVNTAMAELGWSFPVSDKDKCLWIAKRSLRHACYILWVASAQKFKYKQVNLQNRFEHYEKLLKNMDAEYETALSSQSNVFASVESYKLFGTALNAGFVYDYMGRDLTYSDLVNYINTGE
jgi:hypothetical protein